MNDAFAQAQGGVLFIDEAYSLCGHSSFGTDAFEQIVALCTAKEHLRKVPPP